jgi:crotonobetainyl-CoA:carnitine CoA-transferase CaiB-like acyl-CoA transferase
MSQPLDGITVVDLTAAMAGPSCTQLLADFGADVLKIEPPGKGDMLRDFGPPFVKGESYYFLLNNRNKRSMTLNLRTEGGMEVFRKLAAQADVIIESFRPNVKRKLKIDYDDLKGDNPGLIYASVSGFGQTGPYESRAGFDPIAQGMSGLASITGWTHTGPARVGVAIGDSLGGVYAAIGILLALVERQKSGKGQRVESSLLEGLIAVLGFQAAKYFGTNERPEPQGNDHAMMSPYGTFKTKDGYMNIAAGNQAMWERLAKAMALEHLTEEKRFLTVADRVVWRGQWTHSLHRRGFSRSSGPSSENASGDGPSDRWKNEDSGFPCQTQPDPRATRISPASHRTTHRGGSKRTRLWG